MKLQTLTLLKFIITVISIVLAILAPVIVFAVELSRAYGNFCFFKELKKFYKDLTFMLKKAWLKPTVCKVCKALIGGWEDNKDRCRRCLKFNLHPKKGA